MNGVENKENIIVHNAKENNLKGITAVLPLNHFTCVTGPSGCGKSSLVYDTIYAESQRNFLESMSGNMFGQKLMDKPDVEYIENLRPALNISQNYYNVNPRSTVGTITDISYYIRTLFAFIINQRDGKNLDMNYFSANNPTSCCPVCNGLGEDEVVSEALVMPDKEKKLSAGGILYYKGNKKSIEYKTLEALCSAHGIDIDKKVKDLTANERGVLLYSNEVEKYTISYKTPKGRSKKETISVQGAITELNAKLRQKHIPSTCASIAKYLKKTECSCCQGMRLSKNALAMRICGLNIGEVERLSLSELLTWTEKIKEEFSASDYYSQIGQLVSDIERRTQHLIDLKLEYLSVGRSVPTLSGGELQRVRLATQLDCSLSGLIYILDEPCKGLHYKNVVSVINATQDLVEKGNTVIAIEHNKEYISSAENIVEMGPVGGPEGGYITKEYTGGTSYRYSLDFKHTEKAKKYIRLEGVSYHNLKNVGVSIPIGKITCVSGVSGSGKTSLISVIADCCENGESEYCYSVDGNRLIKKVHKVNQQPIGKTPRSTVISYLDIYEAIRKLFENTEEAKQRRLTASEFSMNVVGGRCECCQGTGKKKIELSYLPETYIMCPECKGKRFHDNVLEVQYKGYSINDILNETVHNLLSVFEEESGIHSMLQCMEEIGLGYIRLGQMSMTLSGGEAQRIKLAKQLGTNSNGKNLYILDEPTSGLSNHDIKMLEGIIQRLSENGDTVIIIEHNIEFIAKIADYLIDLGTKAGNNGGDTVLQGFPKEVMSNELSSWKSFLK